MSIPILPTRDSRIHATGITCPKSLAACLFIAQIAGNYETDNMPHLFSDCAITVANTEHIIFQIPSTGKLLEETVGGQYVYDTNWSPWMVKREYFQDQPEALDVYDKIVINVQHWGPPAEMALQFLAKTLE